MKVAVKRAYEKTEKTDGYRVLVDRLWPRGVSKAFAKIDIWPKAVTPSHKLRTWFHKNKASRFSEFSKRYKQELVESGEAKELKQAVREKSTITLVTGVKDIKCSHIPTLQKVLADT